MFSEDKWGYNKKEVDTFVAKQKAELSTTISDLRTQNVELKSEIEEDKIQIENFKRQENKIKDALILATEKAKDVENESKKMYKQELDKVKNLYFKWVNIIEAVRNKYGLVNTEELNTRRFYSDIETLFDNNLRETNLIENEGPNAIVLNSETKIVTVEDQKIHHKELLSRMSGLLHSVSTSVRDASSRPTKVMVEPEEKLATKSEHKGTAERQYSLESERLTKDEYQKSTEQKPSSVFETKLTHQVQSNVDDVNETPSLIKPIFNISTAKGYASLLDKYLSDDYKEDTLGAYGKKIANTEVAKTKVGHMFNIPSKIQTMSKNGFDLKEAVNPKESLEEIMSSFDFYDK